jgi:hypothetical protein
MQSGFKEGVSINGRNILEPSQDIEHLKKMKEGIMRGMTRYRGI